MKFLYHIKWTHNVSSCTRFPISDGMGPSSWLLSKFLMHKLIISNETNEASIITYNTSKLVKLTISIGIRPQSRL